jgi:copper chaperone
METDMPAIGPRTELPQASAHAACGCCSTSATTPPRQATADAEFFVEGLTCGHCVETVQKAASTVEGVHGAAVELVNVGKSRLLISGSADPALIREAVSTAGYSISTSSSPQALRQE